MAQMFVNGEYIDSGSGEVTEIYNPANGDLVDTVPKGTKDDARRAIEVCDEKGRPHSSSCLSQVC